MKPLFLTLAMLLVCHQMQAQLLQKIDEVFAKWNRTDSPGCALTVIKDGKIMHAKGYGMADLEHSIAIQPNSVFYIGSVSKQFVTFCILLLEEQGLVDLDATIQTYFPDFPEYDHPITVRNFIHHTSGIRDYLTLWELKGRSYLDDMDPEKVYELIIRQKELNFEPGTKYLYSNSCYFIMALLVEKVSGQTIKAFAAEHIFGPLQMNSSFFYDDNRDFIHNRAFGYGTRANGSFFNMMMRFDLVGSGGVYSTVEDLYKWDQNFYQNKLGKGGPAIIEKMMTNGKYKDGSEVDYAFALVNDQYRGLQTVGHSGALGGYRANYLRFPDQQTSIIILSNLDRLNPVMRSYEVADVVLADAFTKPTTKNATSSSSEKKEENTYDTWLTPSIMNNMTGRYYAYELDATYDIQVVDDNLVVLLDGQVFPLKPTKPNTLEWNYFTIRFAPNGKQFRLDAGRVTNLLFERE